MRPLVIRKKRCLIFCGLLICFFLSLSWLVDRIHTNSYSSNVNLDFDSGHNRSPVERHITIKPPKLNVLDEPPIHLNKTFEEKSEIIIKDVNDKTKDYTSRRKTTNGQDFIDILQTKRPAIVEHEKIELKDVNLELKKDVNLELKKDVNLKHINKSKVLSNESTDIEVRKNKTLAYLGVIGKEHNGAFPPVIFAQLKWNLSVSFEDIGNIMKDTLFFNKLRPLDFKGPALQSSRNRTANFSLSMPMKMGYCDCWELHCFCCVQLVNPQLHLNSKSCANFTFISKSHEIDLTFSIDGATVHRQLLSADSPPLLCLGSIPMVADVCVHFSNMTYRVDRMNMHKSQLLGCTDFSFNIYNKTVNAFPVDCFQIPGDPNHHPKHEQMMIPNFVP